MRTDRVLVKSISDQEHESSNHPILGGLLWRAASAIIRVEEKLVAKAKGIATDMAKLVQGFEKAKERPYFNSLGELQSRGPNLDRLCGVLDLAYENFDRLYSAWDYVVLHESDRPGGDE